MDVNICSTIVVVGIIGVVVANICSIHSSVLLSDFTIRMFRRGFDGEDSCLLSCLGTSIWSLIVI